MRRWIVPAAALVALAIPAAAQEARPATVPVAAESGEALFATRCAACHDARGFGTRILSRRVPAGQAELTKRASLPAPVVIAVVRNGLGSMPAFRKAELDDRQLRMIAAYLEGRK